MTHSDASTGSERSGGRPRGEDATAHRMSVRLEGKVRRGKTRGVLRRQGSRMVAYERRCWGTEGTRTQRSKGGQCRAELQEGNMSLSTDKGATCPRDS